MVLCLFWYVNLKFVYYQYEHVSEVYSMFCAIICICMQLLCFGKNKDKTLRVVLHCSIIWGCATNILSLPLIIIPHYSFIKQLQHVATYFFCSISFIQVLACHTLCWVANLLTNVRNFDYVAAVQTLVGHVLPCIEI